MAIKEFVGLIGVVALMISCSHEPADLIHDGWDYRPVYVTPKQPPLFPAMQQPANNRMTEAGIALGRSLYNDPILSENGRSCAGCHWQGRAFTADRLVVGLDTGRFYEIMPHQNLGWKPYYNWTGNERLLDSVPHADFGPDFFNTNMTAMKSRLLRHPDYPRQFFRAFGVNVAEVEVQELLPDLISKALGQYLRNMVSANSTFDRFIRKEVGLEPDAWRGYVIFFSEKGECFHCHGYPFMSDHQFHDIGLEAQPAGRHEGRFQVTGATYDRGKFVTPSLRNVALTAPYMHDGRFSTLAEVINHYSEGMQVSPNLDPLFFKHQQTMPGLRLTPQEQADLLTFLNTLTDSTFISQPI